MTFTEDEINLLISGLQEEAHKLYKYTSQVDPIGSDEMREAQVKYHNYQKQRLVSCRALLEKLKSTQQPVADRSEA